MPAVNEHSGTLAVIGEATFHLGAVSRSRLTLSLAGPVRTAVRELKDAHRHTEDLGDVASEKFGALVIADLDVDDRARLLELDMLRLVDKDRTRAEYRAAFPKGLVHILALRGKAEETELKATMKAVRAASPELARRYADVPVLAAAATAAENEWREAEAAAGRAFVAERIVRLDLVRQLQKNEGALLVVFPGKRARVRSFFRTATSRRRRKSGSGAGTPETP